MALNLTQKLIASHRVDGEMHPGEPVAMRFDQTLCQDATGTLVMLTLEAMGLERVRTSVSVQYVDHNLIQEDNRNPDDHRFLESAAQRFGLWFSRPGNGISHPLHMLYFGVPGETLIGSDSHTPAAGALGMLAIGAGGADVATAMAGEPVWLQMPEVWGVELSGELPDWVSAKDVILELLRRHGVEGGVNRIIEYHGPGVEGLSAMDRHVIANMGAELGATSSVFPSDAEVRRFLASEGRDSDWQALAADQGCDYDHQDRIELGSLEPLIARPSSPGKVVPVREVEGEPIYQAYIGSSANPGFRDFAMAARMAEGQQAAAGVSFDINPSSRALLQRLIRSGDLERLVASGARLHQAGCNGCIGMGQAPATGQNSLRTTPRNFPGRSGTPEDRVWLCSPETATASALRGCITDPRNLGIPYPRIELPGRSGLDTTQFVAPPGDNGADRAELVTGPNIVELPHFEALPDRLEVPVLLKVGDDISTDEIMPAGARVLPYRSNVPRIADFVFESLAPGYVDSARDEKARGGHAIVAGRNYGQGSSREHAAIAPRYLGLRLVVAKSFARIHWQNLINYGVLPLTFSDSDDYDRLAQGDVLVLENLQRLAPGQAVQARLKGNDREIDLAHPLSQRQCELILAGGLVNWLKAKA
ncbi:aconitate hydratase [Marinobacterium nitratireducens]|uniref:Aconitate hydratase n=1 Tax=Marinobacterium nitratireducens TaxID=518897 RepID=A0A917Z9D7_9GAMM|nr:aconitate hydratase [Marinobacterium nitratireducens]GGO76863.1 aconitate hydratase [Marinobacterium nitratireducens]